MTPNRLIQRAERRDTASRDNATSQVTRPISVLCVAASGVWPGRRLSRRRYVVAAGRWPR